MKVIEKIKIIRKQKKITQEQIANVLNMSKSNYCEIENAETRLTVEDFIKICEFLNIDINQLTDQEDKILIEITEEEYKAIENLNNKIKNQINISKVNINTTGDVIIGNNNKNNK
ncbi:MAG: helix-turn-helix domain-containing protein [Bacilli bacterium]